MSSDQSSDQVKGESNVIPVDFLQGLSPEKQIDVLQTRTQELDAQEQLLSRETASLIAKAQKMVAANR